MSKKGLRALLTIAIVLSGCSALSGVVALILEKIVFPLTLENYSKLYAPLPYPRMGQSIVELILVIVCCKSYKKDKKSLFYFGEVMIVFSMVAYQLFIRFENLQINVNGMDMINYEYRQLYSVVYTVVSNFEYYSNSISLLLLVFVSGIMTGKKENNF